MNAQEKLAAAQTLQPPKPPQAPKPAPHNSVTWGSIFGNFNKGLKADPPDWYDKFMGKKSSVVKLALAKAISGAGRMAVTGAVGVGGFMGAKHLYDTKIKTNPDYKEFFQAMPQAHRQLGMGLNQAAQQRDADLENIYTGGKTISGTNQ